MARSAKGRTLKQQVQDADRRAVALEVYRRGFRGDAGAAEMRRLGHTACNRGVWHRLVRVAIEEIWAPPAEEVRRVELERLDENHKRLEQVIDDNLDRARKGDKDSIAAVLGGVRGQLAIAERRAKSLGIDAPEKHEHTGKDGAPLLDVGSMTDEQLRAIVSGFVPPKPGPDGSGGTGAPPALAAIPAPAPRAAGDAEVAGAEALGGDRGVDRAGGDDSDSSAR